MSSSARLSAYGCAQRLLSGQSRAVLLLDSIDEAIPSSPGRGGFGRTISGTPSTADVLRLLKNNPVPAIWIVEDVKNCDPSVLRQFDYSIQICVPPQSVRSGLLEASLGAWVNEAPEWFARMSSRDAVTPALIQQVARIAQEAALGTNASPDQERIRRFSERLFDRSAALLGHPTATTARPGCTDFDVAYLNTDVPIDRLVAALGEYPSGTFCFYGPPGTGKSELARFIARAIGRPLIERRSSDLLDPLVGVTEHRIAEMFAQAKSAGAVLLLDEADSFLRSRAKAHRNWEVIHVNELLTQLDAFDGIFICATNAFADLDQAALRRLHWKIEFKPLKPAQRWALFAQEYVRLGGAYDDTVKHRQDVERLSGLTAGDVAAVVRQHRLLNLQPTVDELLRKLNHEVSLRSGQSDARHNEHLKNNASETEETAYAK